MEDEPFVLVPARCPASDDSDVLRLLEGVASAGGASWIELELVTDDLRGSRRYRLGEVRGRGWEVALGLEGSHRALLRLDVDPAAGERVLGLASVALEKILEARRLSEQAELLHGALDLCGRPSLLFDTHGAIVYANPEGDRLLSQQTETMLRVVGPDADGSPLIGHFCRLAEELNGGDDAIAARDELQLSDGSIVQYEIAKVRSHPGGPSLGVLVTLQSAEVGPPRSLRRFAVRHGLSTREEEVVGLLLDGLSTRRIAEQLAISPHTVRDHLKNLYRKTGVGSRAQLVRLATVVCADI